MTCDTILRPRQTLDQRKAEVKAVVDKVSAMLAAGRVKAIVGAKGGIAFQGLAENDRAGVTDGCVYRRIMATGSAAAKMAIARAEALAGRSVDRQAVAQGLHAHGHGDHLHWHDGH